MLAFFEDSFEYEAVMASEFRSARMDVGDLFMAKMRNTQGCPFGIDYGFGFLVVSVLGNV